MKLKLRMLSILAAALCVSAIAFSTNKINASAEAYYSDGVDVNLLLSSSPIRYDEKTITDSSLLDNHFDNISLSSFGQNITNLLAQGYKTMILAFRIDIKEVDDGYQELFVVSSPLPDGIHLATGLTNFEHKPGSTDTKYATYDFYVEINLADVSSTGIFCNSVYLRYGAHGAFSDDWKNKNLYARIGFSTQTRRISKLVCVGKAAGSL